MVFHVLLFKLRSDLSDDEKSALLEAFTEASQKIPFLKRVSVGRRVKHGALYESAAGGDWPYAAILEFEDLAGLKAYLTHPAHEPLGTRFMEALSAGLISDFEMVSGGKADGLVRTELFRDAGE